MIGHVLAHLFARPARPSHAITYDGFIRVRTVLPHGRGEILSRILADGTEVVDAVAPGYASAPVPAPRTAPAPVLVRRAS